MILREIMNKIADDEKAEVGSLRPCDYFNFICGTSTRGLVAILLGRLRFMVQEAIDAYISLSKEIFAIDRSTSIFKRFRTTKGGKGRFDAGILEEKVREIVAVRCNGNRGETV
jgi:patatin-like phospholipase/acyl hydrolase